MADGTTSYEVNVNVIRAAFVYRDVGAAVAIAQRVADAESRGRPMAGAGFRGARASSGTSPGDADAARAAASTRRLRDRDAPQRPHGVIHALATLSLLELDDGEPRAGAPHGPTGPGRRPRRSASPTASPRGLPTWPAGAAWSPWVAPAEGVRELEIATGLLEGRAPIAHHVYALLALAEAQRAAGDLVAAHRSADAAELLIESFDDAGIFPAMLAELRERSLRVRKRRPATPGAELSESELAVLRLLAGAAVAPRDRRRAAASPRTR